VDGPLIFGLALAAGLVCTPLAARVAVRTGVLDHPGALKVQDRPVPYLGGAAVFVAMTAGALAGGIPAQWLLAPALALVLGIVDDVAAISARVRLGAEVMVGIGAGIAVPAPGPAGIALTALMVVALINAVNLLDGLDGLAAGVACVGAAGFAVIGGTGFPLALALAGALLGFLAFNRPPARIYLGDGGSYLLGATLAVLAAGALADESEAAHWLVVPLLVAVPLADTAIAIIRRARGGRPLFEGDRSHVYDQLVDRGRTREQAVVTCIAVQIVLTAAGVVAWNLQPVAAAAVAIAVIALSACVAFALGFAAPTRETIDP
jgi:UDP-GlcNAc:undecaprenyl-phosphate GlcNAc-1-phosphate transferase